MQNNRTPSASDVESELVASIKAAHAKLDNDTTTNAVVVSPGKTNSMSDLFRNITDIYSEDKISQVKKTPVFTMSVSKYVYSLDGSGLEPTAKTRLAGSKFEQRYLEQLESILFNNAETIDETKLFALINLYGHIEQISKQDPNAKIKLISSVYKNTIPQIVRTLNLFIFKNKSVIQSSYRMFTGTFQQTPREAAK